MRRLFNRQMDYTWDDIRDFLALHYHANTRLETPFWRHCREDTDVSGIAELLEFYYENGPTGFARYTLPKPENNFGIEGYLVMLVGNRMPYLGRHHPSAAEQQAWNAHRAAFIAQASGGLTVKEALGYVRHPAWQWNAETSAANVPGIGTPMR
jgi:tryptophan halogenase